MVLFFCFGLFVRSRAVKVTRTVVEAVLATVVAVTVAMGTAWGTLFIVGGLFQQSTMAQTVLACLRVNLKQFDGDFVAFLQACLFNVFKMFPFDFADVKQTFAARHKFNKATVRHDAYNLCIVNGTHFGHGGNGSDFGYGGFGGTLVGCTNLNFSY